MSKIYKVRLFDGYYDAKEEQYNFKYEIINDPLRDNKVGIKINPVIRDNIKPNIIPKTAFANININTYFNIARTNRYS